MPYCRPSRRQEGETVLFFKHELIEVRDDSETSSRSIFHHADARLKGCGRREGIDEEASDAGLFFTLEEFDRSQQ